MPGVLNGWARKFPLFFSFSHWRLIHNDFVKSKIQTKSLDWHLEQCVKWVLASWEATNFKGFSASYSLWFGWDLKPSAYSGYIIPSLWSFYHISENQELKSKVKNCAISLSDLMIEHQLESGAFQGIVEGGMNNFFIKKSRRSNVLQTANSIFGLVATYKQLKEEKYLRSVVQAAHWLISVQEPDGYWVFDYSVKSITDLNAQSAFVALSLLEVYKITSLVEFDFTIRKFYDALLKKQLPNGFFENSFIHSNQNSFLSNLSLIAYSLLESGVFLKQNKYLEHANKLALSLYELFKRDKTFWGSYSYSLIPDKSFKNLSGTLQMAIIYFRLYSIMHKQEYASTFATLNRQIQELTIISAEVGLNGGVRGSFPIWGKYFGMSLTLLGSKHYLDALIFEKEMCGC